MSDQENQKKVIKKEERFSQQSDKTWKTVAKAKEVQKKLKENK